MSYLRYPTKIPLEIVIAAAAGAPGRIMTVAADPQEAAIIFGVLEHGPAGVMMAFVLRRGYVMDWARAGIAAGTLAGLSGLGMLELHCQNLKAIHVIVWHVAVVVLSALLGYLIGRIADEFRRHRAHQG